MDDYVKMEELRKRMKKEKMTKKDVDPTEVRFLCQTFRCIAFNAKERNEKKSLTHRHRCIVDGARNFLFAVP